MKIGERMVQKDGEVELGRARRAAEPPARLRGGAEAAEPLKRAESSVWDRLYGKQMVVKAELGRAAEQGWFIWGNGRR